MVVVKRSLSPGFAGIPNPLFAADNTLMYFADGKKAILDLTAALQHMSVYCLTWERGTAFESARLRGELRPAEEALERAMFEAAIDRLEAA